VITKYNFDIPAETVEINTKRLINQLWKLIPMRENKEDWESQLITLTQELSGFGKILCKEQDFLILLSKLEGLTSETCEDFFIFRKTVFKCIDLLSKVMKK
jgi:hypothetical protein